MPLRLLAFVLGLFCFKIGFAAVALGQTEIAGLAGDGPVTIFYPSSDEPKLQRRGRLTLNLAAEGAVLLGNRRLVVISHGSGGSPWVHADLARSLVEAGFIVALPEHRADNYKDGSDPGPDSWTRRPAEVSRAIDAVAKDPRFGPLLDLERVGVFGMSAGGHTALSLAGGEWSPARFRRHCDADLAADFQSCVGLAARLTGGPLDGFKLTIARWVIRHRFSDERLRVDADPRIAAIVAGVPAAADFDLNSLARPKVPLAIISAQRDLWLIPRFHSAAVLAGCESCEQLSDLSGGHGALLSPLPKLSGLLGDLLNDPPDYDRPTVTSDIDRKITAYFSAHLLQAPVA